MSVACPSCQHKLNPKAARPGRYHAQCPGCDRALVLLVGADGSVTVAPVPDATLVQQEAEAGQLLRDATVAFELGPQEEPHADAGTAPSDKTQEVNMPDAPGAKECTARGELPAVVSNYEILSRLGKGGMGTVYLARQRSLDRLVALKVIDTRWASDPRFLVRFTREAYAAAQLVHHNVVQVYDIGADRDVHWFSMEYVDGTSLSELVMTQGRLDAQTAAGYILQAARGLQFAHERGMVHRDVKPDNLMLNKLGIVKVADLGLVRTPGAVEVAPAAAPAAALPSQPGRKSTLSSSLAGLSGVTLATQTVGTPSYMAPEQTRSAAGVDARADIYSLGCTFYALVTGRMVFQARTATEMMHKHQHEPVTPPQTYVKDLPRSITDVIMKMMTKDPAGRYQSAAALVRALEKFLGVGMDSRSRLAQEKAEILAQGVTGFHTVPAARRRPWMVAGGLAFCGLAFLVALCAGSPVTALSFLGLALLTPLASFVVDGFYTRSHLFLQLRQYLLTGAWFDWIKTAVGTLLFLLLLYLFGLLLAFLMVSVVAVGLAFALYFLVDRPIERRRAGALAAVEKMLKGLRLRGISEDALHKFVCQYAGEDWEEAFEALFGYEAKLAARGKWGSGPKGPRPRFGAWRDPVVRWIQARERARQEARERRYLQKVEQQNLVAAGVQPAEARRQAEAVAEAMVEKAGQIKEASLVDDAPVEGMTRVKAAPETGELVEAEIVEPVADEAPRRAHVDVSELMAVAEKPPPMRRRVRIGKLVAFLLSGGGRFFVGALLILAGIGAFHLGHVADDVRLPSWLDMEAWQANAELLMTARPVLHVPLLTELAVKPISCLAAACAGLLLAVSSLQRLRWLSLMHYLCATVIVAGPGLGVPALGPVDAAVVSIVAGGTLALLLLVRRMIVARRQAAG